MKKQLLMNLLLALIWVSLTGKFSVVNFSFGLFLSFLLLWISTRDEEERKYFSKLPKLISFFFYFLYELVKANLEVAYDVITPKFYMKPGIISVPLDAKTDLEITLLANLITLTPGTLSLDVSEDRKFLFVHAMYITDRDEFIASIKNGFEKRLLELTR
ncbi:MAG: Na+/H+ antiporter subunit E [Leptospira sp.]|nr:Na+/H+ antiporter subunit E [Leptospira sp.]